MTIANSGRQRRISMARFIVEPHFRLQEWVAQEKGYFRDSGLDYEFRELIRSTEGQHHNKGGRGAFQSIEQGREANVSCACHWTVNVAASTGHTKLYADLYSIAPSGIFVAADSKVRTPADLANVPISVGFQSGSHYSTIQALEQYIPPGEINLIFEDGMLFSRMERFIDGKSPAAALFNGPYYLAEQLGFRKVIDTTFIIAAMIKGSPDPEDIRRYFRALRSAQRDIDLRPERYTHYYKNEFPDRFARGGRDAAKKAAQEKGRLVSQTAFPVLRQLHIVGRFQDLCAGGLSPSRILIGCRCKSGQSRTVARTDAMISHLRKMID